VQSDLNIKKSYAYKIIHTLHVEDPNSRLIVQSSHTRLPRKKIMPIWLKFIF